MSQVKVVALQGFDHEGPRRRGAEFYMPVRTAKALEQNGLVEIVKAKKGASAVPPKAAGKKSSASPAARASRKKTLPPSDAGDTADQQTPPERPDQDLPQQEG